MVKKFRLSPDCVAFLATNDGMSPLNGVAIGFFMLNMPKYALIAYPSVVTL